MAIIKMLNTQQGRLSLARMAALVAFLIWVVATLYTLLLNRSYAHYDALSATMLVLFMVVLVGKSIDSKILSVRIEGDKNG